MESTGETRADSPLGRICRFLTSRNGFGVLMGVLLLATFPKVFLGTEVFFYRDFGQLSFTTLFHNRESFWRGEVPVWSPWNNCGIPYLAQWNTMSLYPFSLFCYLLPISWSASVFGLLHLWWGAMGMYWLARRLTGSELAAVVGGVAYVFNGLVFSSIMWTNYLVALGWLPWMLGFAEQWWREGGKRWIPAALSAALVMLTGTPELTLLAWAFLTGWMLLDRGAPQPVPMVKRVLRHGWLILMVAALSAAQLLPFFELLGASQRDAGFGGTSWSMPGTGWANFLLPLFYTFQWSHGVYFQYDQSLLTSYYPGIGVLLLVVIAVGRSKDRRTIWLWSFALLSVLLSLGAESPVYRGLKAIIPQLGLMRYPVKFLFSLYFILPLLAAMGVKALLDSDAARIRQHSRWIVCVATVFAGCMAGLVWFAEHFPQFPGPFSRVDILTANAIQRGVALTVIAGLLLWLLRGDSKSKTIAVFALVAALWADVRWHVPDQNPTVSRDAFSTEIEPLLKGEEPLQGRIMPHPKAEIALHELSSEDAVKDTVFKRHGRYGNFNLMSREKKVHGSYALVLRDTEEVNSLFYSTGSVLPGLADFLSVRRVSAATNPLDWTNRSSALPLVTGGQQVVFAGRDETLKALKSAEFSPAATVYMTEEMRASVSFTNSSPVRITDFSWGTHRLSFNVSAEAPSVVVVAQSWHPSWKLRVDRSSAPLMRANHAFQAFTVGPGEHSVEMVFSDRAFQAGAAISWLALGLCGIVWMAGSRHPR